MHQTRKGDNWYFGMKAHIGVDADTGVVHTLVTTPANTSDVTQAHNLLHGEEKVVFGDAGYQGVEVRAENQGREINWMVSMRYGKRKALPDTIPGRLCEQVERLKSCIRARVEHPFNIIRNILGLKKARYRGLARNTAQLFTLSGLAVDCQAAIMCHSRPGRVLKGQKRGQTQENRQKITVSRAFQGNQTHPHGKVSIIPTCFINASTKTLIHQRVHK
jgi:IS5 family transposase